MDDVKLSEMGKDTNDVDVQVLPSQDGTSQTPQVDAFHNDAQRGLRMRHLQLIAISGAIGSSVFVSIGNPLTGGPLALLLGVMLWSSVVWCINNCMIEMCTLLPVQGGFIHYATRFLDPALGFSLGWNYFICQVSLICNELTVMNVLVAYWDPTLNAAVCISVGLALLVIVQALNVRVYGESEFWISIIKIFMILGAFIFTFITMVGGNPIHDKYGFRFWKTPGPFTATTSLGRAQDIWAALQWSAYAVVGPDYISLVAGEVRHPRRVLPKAFNSTTFRILAFYIGGAFFAGLNAAADDPSLLGAHGSGAAKSPYIINMIRLKIPILPSILTAGLLLSLFSSASAMAFAASRTLYSLALQRQAPRCLLRTNRSGLPYLCVLVSLSLGGLSYLALSSGTRTVLDWFINLTAATQFVTWIAVAGQVHSTYLRFRAGMKAQDLGPDFLPVRGRWQPWSGWYVLFWAPFALIFSGYFIMGPGEFDVPDFLFTYGAIFIFIALSIGWKLKGARHQRAWFGIPAAEMDFKTGLAEIEELTLRSEEEWATEPQSRLDRIVNKVF